MNIEHPTSNIQRRMWFVSLKRSAFLDHQPRTNRSMFSVQCSMLDIHSVWPLGFCLRWFCLLSVISRPLRSSSQRLYFFFLDHRESPIKQNHQCCASVKSLIIKTIFFPLISIYYWSSFFSAALCTLWEMIYCSLARWIPTSVFWHSVLWNSALGGSVVLKFRGSDTPSSAFQSNPQNKLD